METTKALYINMFISFLLAVVVAVVVNIGPRFSQDTALICSYITFFGMLAVLFLVKIYNKFGLRQGV